MAQRYKSTSSNPLIPRNTKALGIDPGYSAASGGCAVAHGIGGLLVDVRFERADAFAHSCASLDLDYVIVEQPQQDGRSASVPPAVLIKLSWEGCKLAALYAGASGAVLHDPTPSEWKGSEAKPAMHLRLFEILNTAERAVLGGKATAAQIEAACERGAMCRWSKPGAALYPSSFKIHNLLDAAALLMWAYGRLEKVG